MLACTGGELAYWAIVQTPCTGFYWFIYSSWICSFFGLCLQIDVITSDLFSSSLVFFLVIAVCFHTPFIEQFSYCIPVRYNCCLECFCFLFGEVLFYVLPPDLREHLYAYPFEISAGQVTYLYFIGVNFWGVSCLFFIFFVLWFPCLLLVSPDIQRFQVPLSHLCLLNCYLCAYILDYDMARPITTLSRQDRIVIYLWTSVLVTWLFCENLSVNFYFTYILLCLSNFTVENWWFRGRSWGGIVTPVLGITNLTCTYFLSYLTVRAKEKKAHKASPSEESYSCMVITLVTFPWDFLVSKWNWMSFVCFQLGGADDAG